MIKKRSQNTWILVVVAVKKGREKEEGNIAEVWDGGRRTGGEREIKFGTRRVESQIGMRMGTRSWIIQKIGTVAS